MEFSDYFQLIPAGIPLDPSGFRPDPTEIPGFLIIFMIVLLIFYLFYLVIFG
jgi:hypothetical protein